MDVKGVGGTYGPGIDTEEERRRLDEKLATSKVLNQMAKDAKVIDRGVHVSGDDMTYAELRAEQRGEHLGALDVGAKGYSVATGAAELLAGESSALARFAEHVSGSAFAAAEPFVIGYELVKGVSEDVEKGQELKATLARDAMHLALVTSVRGMPPCFVDHEKEVRADAARGEKAGYGRIVAELNKPENASLRVALQVRCDEGMTMARTWIDGGHNGGAVEFLRAQGLERRYREDAAFRAGFDGAVFAASHAPDQYARAMHELTARDERLNLHRVFRG